MTSSAFVGLDSNVAAENTALLRARALIITQEASSSHLCNVFCESLLQACASWQSFLLYHDLRRE